MGEIPRFKANNNEPRLVSFSRPRWKQKRSKKEAKMNLQRASHILQRGLRDSGLLRRKIAVDDQRYSYI